MSDTLNKSAMIWAVAELLRGDYKQHEYGERITHVWPERKGEQYRER